MRSGITRRWLRGSLLITVLLVLLAETMFLYNYTRSYYNSVQQTMYRRFSSVSGQLKMYTGDTVQSTAATRSVALRRMVEQFADKDKYEFMLLDSYGGVIASSSGTNADGIVTGIDFEQAQEASDGLGVAVYRTQSGELVMAACYLVPYAAEDVAAMRLVTSLTLVGAQIKNAIAVSVVIAAVILAFTVMSGLYFIRSIVVPLGQVERIAADIARGEFDVRLPVSGDARDEVDRLRGTINQMAEGLEETEKMKNEFISSVSHELRSPMTCMRGYVEAMLDGTIPQEEYPRYLQIVYDETNRMKRLIADLLQLSRMDNGVEKLQWSDFDINELIRRLLIGRMNDIEQKSLDLQLDFAVDPCMVHADSDRISQVVLNIVDNALKYISQNGHLTIRTQLMQNSIVAVEIKNDGEPIAAQDRAHVFERFYMAEKAHTSGKGTGLGLSICKQIMEMHGQTIEVLPLDAGAGFRFTLQAAQTPGQPQLGA